MLNLPHYLIHAAIYESAHSIVYRGLRKEDNQAVILKMLKEDYPTPEDLMRYHQEYDLTKTLNLESVVKTYALEKYQNTLIIVLEDFGAQSLKSAFSEEAGQISLSHFLSIASKICDALGQIHAVNIIHKDINPANIVWNQVTDEVKIIDFGIASRLPHECPTLKNPEQLEGTLPYISPEQTGRMNRALDYRTDLYSLGVTLYELLTGKLPFESDSALELVHCQMAKTPRHICELNPDVPTILCDIIMKLMAKNVEDRYQSAFGVKADIEKCLANLPILQDFNFQLGKNDFSGKLQIPEKLYGREKEVNSLLEAFERVSQGAGEMMLVAGYSGVGKTALVHEVHKPMTSKKGYFAAGKFDQYQRNIPYFAISQAFNDFCNYLLTENAEALKQWRDKILNAVGSNGQVLIDVIPQLALVIGPQPEIVQIGPIEAQNRFNLVFQNFFRAICQKSNPFVLFIDDLQWADLSALNLLKTLMTDTERQSFLIIAAYRDNEVDPHHPLLLTVEALQKFGVLVNTISLENLSKAQVNILIAETLSTEPLSTQPLSNLVYEKTQGNAFFTHEFLKALYQQDLLTFDLKTQTWHWHINDIAALDMTSNVVDLMASKIKELPTQTLEVVKLASCLGNSFDLKTLSLIYQESLLNTLDHLWQAIKEGLLEPLNAHYKQREKLKNNEANPLFKFQHDRVQQAAYSLIAEANKAFLHWEIGHLLLEDLGNNSLFDIVDHLNLGLSLAENQNQYEIAQLNLRAGQKAKAAMAYEPALNYFNTGRNLLLKDSWQTEYSLTLNFYLESAETELLSTHFEESERLVQVVLEQAENFQNKLRAYEVLIRLYIAQNRIKLALETGLQVLKRLEVHLEKYPPKLNIEACYTLPEMTKPDKLAAMRILNLSISPAYTVAPELYPQLVFTMVKLSFEYGNSLLSAYGYSNYGSLLCAISSDFDAGYQAVQLATHLLAQGEGKEFKAKVLTSNHVITHYWKKHARESIEGLQEAIQSGLEFGDLEYVGIAAMHQGSYLFWVGEKLNIAHKKVSKLTKLLISIKQNYQRVYLTIWKQLLLNLQERHSRPDALVGEAFNEETSLPELLKTNYGMAIFAVYLAKTMLSYLFRDYPAALVNIALAEKYEQANLGIMVVPIFKFYASLTLLAAYPSTSFNKQQEMIRQIELNQEQMKVWASHAPMNFEHRYHLVEAEKARVFGEELQAIDLYEKAIVLAKENKYLHEQALAYELSGEFYLARGMTRFAKTELKEAHYHYQQWGALAKVYDLEDRYPQFFSQTSTNSIEKLRSTTLLMSSVTPRMTSSVVLDLESVMKAAQTLSGEIVLKKLFEKMMHIVIENAGAQRGFLILEKNEQWVIEAEGTVEDEKVRVLHSLPIENHLPEAIISYVARTCDNVVLANAKQEGLYTDNDYIKTHQTQSVLCFPIVYQKKLRAILYLENNLSTGIFTEARLNVLKMLSSQIAISLENAQYATQLEDEVRKRTKQLAQANAELGAANVEIRVLNQCLEKENLRMSAELDIARHLQQMVLPKPEELEKIEELDIACFMAPADEVCGDYYDILKHEGHIKIGIGDVTGHGLESGVLMLMVQTAVQTLLTTDIRDPEDFLNILNQAIYNNVQRLQTDKNLTLSLLDYEANEEGGLLRVTGQHEEILFVTQAGEVERIDTFDLGFLVGVKADISPFVMQKKMALQQGEGIVLYTDGITEAQNMEHKQYGVERLCEMISEYWHLSAEGVQNAVIADLRQHIATEKVYDDITLLILKQK
jgi:predicted ATPase/serine phosphatase RsbU (regulator of sigma subunit)/tRNA A-37 threonylcarbamoyl transferase component Bud32